MAFKLDYFVRETGLSLKRNLTLTAASLVTVTVSLALFCFSLWLRAAVDTASASWRGGVEFIVFMNGDATQAQIDAVGNALKTNPEVKKTTYLDKDQALEDFKRLFDDPGLLETVTQGGENILPTSFRVVPRTADADSVQSLGTTFSQLDGVMTVKFGADQIRRLQKVTGFLQSLALGGAILLLVAAVLLILNTIRTAMFARRREIEVMKLVGATNWFIRVPFMLEGLIQGLLGGVLAFVGLKLGHSWFQGQIEPGKTLKDLSALSVEVGRINTIGIWVVVVGVVAGTLGSGIAVTRFLDV